MKKQAGLITLIVLFSGLSLMIPPSQAITPTVTPVPGLTDNQMRTLNSLEQVDDHPLYVMHYYGDYENLPDTQAAIPTNPEPWACSLFAALADPEAMIYGRNFDWEHSPAVLLFTHPDEGYDSVSMVDIAYLGLDTGLLDQPFEDRLSLLNAPFLPFDGMNEHGLAIGMAAVDQVGDIPSDPDLETLGSLGIMREVLDHAATVEEAITLFEGHNIDFSGGPMIHYLIADTTGHSALIEFYAGEMVITRDQRIATNFIKAQAGDDTANWCQRYDTIEAQFEENGEQLTTDDAMQLLSDVAQGHTQWSVVYEMNTHTIHVVMGKHYDTVHSFELE
jgi:hypothetical protein